MQNMNPYATKQAKPTDFLVDFDRPPQTPELEAAKWQAWCGAFGTVE